MVSPVFNLRAYNPSVRVHGGTLEPGHQKKGKHTRPGRFYIYSGAQSFSASNSFLVLADHGFLLLHLR